MYPLSEILFPHSCVPYLRHLVDERWAQLIDTVLREGEGSEIGLAFSLMMIHLCGCMQCDMSAYKSTLGCRICSQRAVAGVKDGSDGLLRRLDEAQRELRAYLTAHGGIPDVPSSQLPYVEPVERRR